MYYSKKDEQEFERILEVFRDYLEQSPQFDVVPSKVGYIMIPIDDGEMSCVITAEELETPANLCELCFFEMAEDIRDELVASSPPLYACSEEIKQEILARIAPYMEKLPEYQYLVEEFFIDPFENY
ncbi:hypothetical protein [Hominenteromicrobium sp.]|uniref:hypothetical protein n=1 Tax=Hominenteromicrobium sp. TaxID=3073581 RepID=UPI00399994EF